MSADNGIYILKSPIQCSPNTFEYRVAKCSAIENIDYRVEYEVLLFGRSKIYTEDDAWKRAIKISKQTPVLEYGIKLLERDHPFPGWTLEEARVRLALPNYHSRD